MKHRLPRLALGLPAVLLLLVFLVWPYVEMITMSFRTSQPGAMYGLGHTVDNYRKVMTSTLYLDALARSLLTAAIITAICLVISYPIAWHMSRARGRKALLLYACVASPLMIGVLIRNFGWMIVVNVDGPLNRSLLMLGIIDRPMRLLFTQGLVVMALVHVFTPFMVLPINNALRNINPAILEASEVAGRRPNRHLLEGDLSPELSGRAARGHSRLRPGDRRLRDAGATRRTDGVLDADLGRAGAGRLLRLAAGSGTGGRNGDRIVDRGDRLLFATQRLMERVRA